MVVLTAGFHRATFVRAPTIIVSPASSKEANEVFDCDRHWLQKKEPELILHSWNILMVHSSGVVDEGGKEKREIELEVRRS